MQAAQQSFENCALTGNDVSAMIETPPDKKMGDYALPCFRLSKVMRCAPQMIAGKLAEKVACEEIDHVEVVGGYLNVFLRRGGLARDIVEAVLAHPGRWGSSEIGKGKTVCLDYSSINIAKRFHIGHLSTTMIGNSLKRIYDFNGYTTVGINHLGDWGTQFGKMICAYKKWGNREEVEKGGVQAMVDLYVRFHHEAEQHPELEDEGRAWFKKIEDGDKEAMEIFTWFKEVTLKDTQRVYDLLGVSFDSYAGESFYNDKMAPVVEELREKGLLIESQGAQVVDLEAYGMPPALILRSDGATLYITRDLAAAFYRHNTYHFDKCLYVVAYQQNLHFKQLFKIIELMGHDWYKGMEHVSFGMVSYEGRALSTREGYVVSRAYSGTEAVMSVKLCKPDLVLLDLMLPGLSGEEVLPQLRGIPVIVMSAKASVDSKVELLLGGAADYVTKPFVMRELLARIVAALRPSAAAEPETLTFGALRLDTGARTVSCGENEARLTRTEYAILKLLMLNPGQVVTRSVILERIAEDTPDCTESSLKIHISHLRRKLREAGAGDCIEAVWGIGFRLREG